MREVRDTSQLLESRGSSRSRRSEVASYGDARHSIVRLLRLIGCVVAVAVAARGLGLRRIEVRGPSMIPTLDDGDHVLVRHVRRLRVGDVVVAADPIDVDRVLVKRVAAISDGRIVLLGDNTGASRDSRDFGSLARDGVTGVVWYRYLPAGRHGRLQRPPRATPAPGIP